MTREYGVFRRRLLFEEDENREEENLRIIIYTHNNNVLYDIIWGTFTLETNNVIVNLGQRKFSFSHSMRNGEANSRVN
jgi:hypothetical protein